MLEKNQNRITELHKKIADIYEEINAIREADIAEKKELREARRSQRAPRREYRNDYQREMRAENHYGERLYNRWEQWEVDLFEKAGLEAKEIARLTGRSLIAVEAKLFKLQHGLNKKESV